MPDLERVESGEPAEIFERIAARHLSDPSVSAGTGFGSSPGLRVGGKVFAMLVRDQLVVKLPRRQVDELVEAGRCDRFDPGHGRVMKEWVAVPVTHAGDWARLVDDALAYVGRRA